MTTTNKPVTRDWQDGWLKTAVHCRSPNFGPRPADAVVNLTVVHSISLPPGHYGGGHIERLFTNQLDWDEHPYFQQIKGLEVSSHFVINRFGVITQFVSVHDRAWHAGKSSFLDRDNCNDYSVGIELEGLEHKAFSPAQYHALVSLIKKLHHVLPIAHVAGHEHISPDRKQDPGNAFDWVWLMQLMGQQGLSRDMDELKINLMLRKD